MKEDKIINFSKKNEGKIFISLDFTAMSNIEGFCQILSDFGLETCNQHVRGHNQTTNVSVHNVGLSF